MTLRFVRGRIEVLVLLLIGLLCLTGCEAVEMMTNNNAIEDLSQRFSRAEVEAFIGAPIPASATNVFTAGEAALDTMVIARFDLPRGEVTAFLSAAGITSPLSDGYTPFFSGTPPYAEADWWQAPTPSSSGSYQGVNEGVNGRVYNVVVVNPAADVVTVYLQVFNT